DQFLEYGFLENHWDDNQHECGCGCVHRLDGAWIHGRILRIFQICACGVFLQSAAGDSVRQTAQAAEAVYAGIHPVCSGAEDTRWRCARRAPEADTPRSLQENDTGRSTSEWHGG